jgi:thiopeptide-type bacteriocin biosynthesis protein
VSWRPPLYRYEIPIVGPRDPANGTALDLNDLYVRLEGDRLILWSGRLHQRVVPRLSSMQAVRPERDLPLYSFLVGLQVDEQLTDSNDQTLWGALYQLPWLPRVRYGSTVLSRESWVIQLRELRSPPARQLEALQRLLEKRGLPRRVVLTDLDHELPLDLTAPWALRNILRVLRASGSARLQECLSSRLRAIAQGEAGRFANEVVIPFHRAPGRSPGRERASVADFTAPQLAAGQDFAPGSEWLYVKVYTPPALMNALLLESIGPACRALIEEGAADEWFFLRYAERGHHLRVRLHCTRADGWSEAYGRIAAALRSRQHYADVRLEIGTYQPEVRRYGGRDALRETEHIFHLNSELVLAHLAEARGEIGGTASFEAATTLLHRFVVALGAAELEEQSAIIERALRLMSGTWSAERSRTALAAANELHREIRTSLAQRLAGSSGSDLPGAEWLGALRSRAWAARQAVTRCRIVSLEDWVISLLHMHCNRCFDDHQREHEYLAYALLSRQYAARRGRMTAPVPAEVQC